MIEKMALAILAEQRKEAFPSNLNLAIAALKATREPTPAMIAAGVKVLAEEWGVIGERAAEELAEIVYRAMTDAAISEAETE